jgi:hypothetical protein
MPILGTRWRHLTDLSFEHLWSHERFREIMFAGIRRTSVDLTTRFGEALGLEAEVEGGRTIWRTFDPAEAPLLARMIRASGVASVKLGSRVLLGPEISYLQLKRPTGSRSSTMGTSCAIVSICNSTAPRRSGSSPSTTSPSDPSVSSRSSPTG